ncbi:MAG: DUF3429 domain-containing protein, partial [Pseudomonadota bacterium]
IVVFMAGVHWGHYLSDSKSHSINLLLFSNTITLLAWFAYLFAPVKLTLFVYCMAFCSLLYIDYKLYLLEVITKSYLKLRVMVTSIVVASLLLASVNLFIL